jgi:hypothetical protein
MEKIELRDYFAGQIMANTVGIAIFAIPLRRNIAKEGEKAEWVTIPEEEVAAEAIEKAATYAYVIADAMLKARGGTA